ncbi:MAG: hypothetical protein LUC97_01430 [Clostridiales bacterium]|nr:hypothetical protein [Clostridiales bacterium]
MACFLVPTAEAVAATIVKKNADKHKKEGREQNIFMSKLNWLNNMLWGGSALLAFEHIWHGEVTPWFPFLTNAVNAADRAEMFYEMATSGTAMAALVTVTWACMVMAVNAAQKKETAFSEETVVNGELK